MSDRKGQRLRSLISLLGAAGNCRRTSSGTGAAWVTPKKFLCTVSRGMSSGELPRLSAGDNRQKTSFVPAPRVPPLRSQERDSHAAVGFPEEKGAGAAAAQLCGVGGAAHGSPCPASPPSLLLQRDAGARMSTEGWEQHRAL